METKHKAHVAMPKLYSLQIFKCGIQAENLDFSFHVDQFQTTFSDTTQKPMANADIQKYEIVWLLLRVEDNYLEKTSTRPSELIN